MSAKCVIIEDSEMFLQMLGTMLRLQSNLRLSGLARSVREGIALARRHRPDLLILDLGLPDGSGLELADWARQHLPAAKIVVLSAEAGHFACPERNRSQLCAVVDKAQAFDDLQEVLQRFESNAESYRPDMEDPGARLSWREREILLLMGQGLTSKEIAGRLFISVHTVQAHRKHIANKLGTAGNELVRRAMLYHQELRQLCPATGTSAVA